MNLYLFAIFATILNFSYGRNIFATVIRNDINSTSPLILGHGYDILLGEKRSRCLEFDLEILIPEDGPAFSELSSEFIIQAINSYEALDSFKNINIGGRIKSLYYGGDLQYDRTSVHKLSSDRFSVGIKLNRIYGREYLNPKKITYLEGTPQDINDFYSKCGQEYVAGFYKGQGISVIASSVKNYVYDYDKLTSEINLHLKSGVTNGEFNFRFKNALEKIATLGNFEIEVISHGMTNKNKHFEKIVQSRGDLNELMIKISEMIGDSVAENSIRMFYITEPYFQKESYENHNFLNVKKNALKRIIYLYQQLGDTLEMTEEIMESHLLKNPMLMKKNYFKKIQKKRESIIDLMTMLEQKAKECLSSHELTKCTINNNEYKKLLTIKKPDEVLFRIMASFGKK